VPVFCDEIQSGAWYGELFLFRRYRIQPDLVAIGKGFPGGVYPASRLLLTPGMDRLSQFGALVTNGQEELASLAYLITMEFVRANGERIDAIGRDYQERLSRLTERFPRLLAAVTGDGHMGCLQFHQPEVAVEFCRRLDDRGVDISTQAYKPSAPPTALTKLPVISDETTVSAVVDRMESVLQELAPQPVTPA
jgi:acetylornithine/succinyldiaminopimelate/putrescine aminotransferase